MPSHHFLITQKEFLRIQARLARSEEIRRAEEQAVLDRLAAQEAERRRVAAAKREAARRAELERLAAIEAERRRKEEELRAFEKACGCQ